MPLWVGLYAHSPRGRLRSSAARCGLSAAIPHAELHSAAVVVIICRPAGAPGPLPLTIAINMSPRWGSPMLHNSFGCQASEKRHIYRKIIEVCFELREIDTLKQQCKSSLNFHIVAKLQRSGIFIGVIIAVCLGASEKRHIYSKNYQ